MTASIKYKLITPGRFLFKKRYPINTSQGRYKGIALLNVSDNITPFTIPMVIKLLTLIFIMFDKKPKTRKKATNNKTAYASRNKSEGFK